MINVKNLPIPVVFENLQQIQYLALKRMTDIFVALIALLVLSPLLLGLAFLISTDGHSPFYSQKRVGQDGKEFEFYKFRTMVPNADQLRAQLEQQNEMGCGVIFKMRRDPRITRIGFWLRKFSLDELPQLWNVLIGDMSLVGPRPALPSEVANYSAQQRQRLSIQQGLTCFWQVNGRNELDFHQQVVLDLAYIKQRSLLTDFTLLLKTIPAVISGKGAY